MSAVFALIPELEPVIAHGSREKCADILQRITTLFLLGADTYNDLHLDLFDDVLGLLIDNTESNACAEFAVRLAPVTNAPVRVLRRLARDDDVAIAGPVLRLSPRLPEADLIDLAATKSRAHLLAIAARPVLSDAVAGVLMRRGDPEVVREIADNRRRHTPGPDCGRAAKRADMDCSVIGHNDSAGSRRAVGLSSSGHLTETMLTTFCREAQYQEAVVALATLAKVPVSVADRVVSGERPDPVLILCKAADLAWPTVKAIFLMRGDRKGLSAEDFDRAFANYSGLSAATAQRVVRFWRARQHT